MRGKVPTPLVAALAILLLPAAPALAVDPATIANAGTGTVVACASCHGKDGGGQASFPRLAGMNAAYLLKQLQDFDSGSRGNAVMKPIATALSPADRNAMANYYAALPIPAVLAAAVQATDASPGARLATRGMWSKGIPACVQCHGPGGVGVGANFPSIAGQPSGYIASQLQAWQKGTRKNDPLELMQHLSRSLTDAEIKAVSEWFASQPPNASGAGS